MDKPNEEKVWEKIIQESNDLLDRFENSIGLRPGLLDVPMVYSRVGDYKPKED